jgi:predicted MPP superfamily phosphohydrolase
MTIGVLAIYGLLIEPSWIEVTEHRQKMKLPIKIAQVSDVHLSPWNITTSRIYAKLNAIKPDVIVLTGDIADSLDDLDGALQTFLKNLPKAKTIAILGNWEHWSGIPLDKLREIYDAHDVKLLINEVDSFNGVQFVGLDDSTETVPDLAAMNKLLPWTPTIVLEHSPGSFDQISKAIPVQTETATMLSGHTHGGQVSLFGFAPVTPPGSGNYVGGWYKDDRGRQLYVSRGLGASILNVRFGARPEIAVFE